MRNPVKVFSKMKYIEFENVQPKRYLIDEYGWVYDTYNHKVINPVMGRYMNVSLQLVKVKKERVKFKPFLVHRLVANMYIGNVKDKVVNHIDCNRYNNHHSNLEIVSQYDNIIHSIDNGLQVASKLNVDKIYAILDMISNNIPPTEILDTYKIAISTFNDIIHKRTWKKYTSHVDLMEYRNKFDFEFAEIRRLRG